jgi:hypothetical protein
LQSRAKVRESNLSKSLDFLAEIDCKYGPIMCETLTIAGDQMRRVWYKRRLINIVNEFSCMNDKRHAKFEDSLVQTFSRLRTVFSTLASEEAEFTVW